jgi:hypothetical protein
VKIPGFDEERVGWMSLKTKNMTQLREVDAQFDP